MSNQNNNFVGKLKNMAKKNTSDTVEVVTNCDHLRSLKFSPVPHYVFTEEGIAQLSSVLRSDLATQNNSSWIWRSIMSNMSL